MDDLDQKQTKHTGDDRVEFVDLDAVQPGPDADQGQGRREPIHVKSRLPPRLSFLRQRRVQVAATSAILLITIAVLLSVSGGFSWLAAQVQPKVAVQPSPTHRAGVYVPPTSQQQDGIACLINAAWSPDSRQVAVLGYGQYCPIDQGTIPPGRVNIYDPVSGKLVRQMGIDTFVLRALDQRFSQISGAPYIQYDLVNWSPDGQELAVPFYAVFMNGSSQREYAGLLLIAPQGTGSRVFLWQDIGGNANNGYPNHLEWDLQRGVANVVYDKVQPYVPQLNTIPLAPAYVWGVNGVLMPASLSSNGTGPVGNPDGDAFFTVWQPGYASRVTQFEVGPVYLPGVYAWSTQFTAWSPDGRYFIDSMYTSGRFIMPHLAPPNHKTLVALNMDQLATLNIRDNALARVLGSLQITSSSVEVAWRPDGRELATYYAGQVEIYDCATGKKLASLIPPNKPANLDGSETFGWSPDGSHLLLSSNIWGLLNLWGPGQLPA